MKNTTPPDKRVRLAEVNRAFTWLPEGRDGRKLHVSTWYRWATRGVRGVTLRTERCGGALCTTEAWVREFFEALSDPPGVRGDTRALKVRVRDLARTENILAAEGL